MHFFFLQVAQFIINQFQLNLLFPVKFIDSPLYDSTILLGFHAQHLYFLLKFPVYFLFMPLHFNGFFFILPPLALVGFHQVPLIFQNIHFIAGFPLQVCYFILVYFFLAQDFYIQFINPFL